MLVRIEKLIYGGEGLAHSDGDTLFVPFVLPGEEAEVTAIERARKFSRCRLDRVLTPSTDRIEPACPYFRACGGCHYQHISYEAQLRLKEDILRETLRRLGRLDWRHPITVHASPPFGYRNRAQWKIRTVGGDPGQSARDSENGSGLDIGYFRAGTSALCPIESCAILSPRLSTVLDNLRRALVDRVLPDGIQEIAAFVDANDQALLVTVSCSSAKIIKKSVADSLAATIEGAESVLLQETTENRMELRGPGCLGYKVGAKNFQVGHLSFFQVNRHLLEELARAAARSAGSGNLAFDLYAGVGLLSVFLADNFSTVESVEADPAAGRDLEINAAANARNISTHNLTAESFLSHWKRKRGAEKPDAVVLDPPRAGLEPGVVRELLAIAAPAIIYVSCDPATLARDLAQLCARAYKVEEIHLFDMFPQTYHMETLVRMERVG